MFAAIHAIYSVVKANYTIDIFHTDEESMPFTAWFFNTDLKIPLCSPFTKGETSDSPLGKEGGAPKYLLGREIFS